MWRFGEEEPVSAVSSHLLIDGLHDPHNHHQVWAEVEGEHGDQPPGPAEQCGPDAGAEAERGQPPQGGLGGKAHLWLTDTLLMPTSDWFTGGWVRAEDCGPWTEAVREGAGGQGPWGQALRGLLHLRDQEDFFRWGRSYCYQEEKLLQEPLWWRTSADSQETGIQTRPKLTEHCQQAQGRSSVQVLFSRVMP